MTLAPGDRFGRYVVDALIGLGGMGQVIRATDTLLDRPVALKVIRPELAKDEEVVARFYREARLAAQVRHPNTVAVFDVGVIDGVPFLAMELVEGDTLVRYIGAAVPTSRKVQWMLGVARGLAAAHAQGLLHRDVKPPNVMISRDGIAKLIDFGMAKGTSTNANLRSTFRTQLGYVVGTPAYMAPEQLEAGETDPRADQFAWAVTAYELLTGVNPRMADPSLAKSVAPITSLASDVAPRVAEVVARALSRRPDARFATMDDLVASLVAALDEPPPVAGPRAAPYEDERTDMSTPPDDWTFEADERASASKAPHAGLTPFRAADAVVLTGRAIGVSERGAIVFEDAWQDLVLPPFPLDVTQVRAVRLLPQRTVAVAGKDSLAVVVPASVRPRDEAEKRRQFGRAHMLAPPWRRWAHVAGARFDGVAARGESSFVFVGQRDARGIALFATDGSATLRELACAPLMAVDTDAQGRSIACGFDGAVAFLDTASAPTVSVGPVDLFCAAAYEGRALVGGDAGYVALVDATGHVERETLDTKALVTAVAWDALAGAWAATRKGDVFHRTADGAWKRVHALGAPVAALRAEGDDVVALGADGTIARGRRSDLR